METSMLPKGKIETSIIFFGQYVGVISILLFFVGVPLIIYSFILLLGQKITKRKIANLHKKKQELFLEIQQITEEQKRTLAELAKLNAKQYLSQHEEIQNDVFFVKDVKFEKDAKTQEEQKFAETQGEKLAPEVEKEITQPGNEIVVKNNVHVAPELFEINSEFSESIIYPAIPISILL